MKNKFRFLFSALMLSILASSCNQEPEDVSVAPNRDSISLNEEVTFTISGSVQDYCNFNWSLPNDGKDENPASLVEETDFEVVSGFEEGDLTTTMKFFKAGRWEVGILFEDCKSGCSEKCRTWMKDAYIEVN